MYWPHRCYVCFCWLISLGELISHPVSLYLLFLSGYSKADFAVLFISFDDLFDCYFLYEPTFVRKNLNKIQLCPFLPCESVKASNGVNIGMRMAAVVEVIVVVVVKEAVVVVVEFCVNTPCMVMMLMIKKGLPIIRMSSRTAIFGVLLKVNS